jgi:hypothetical protein
MIVLTTSRKTQPMRGAGLKPTGLLGVALERASLGRCTVVLPSNTILSERKSRGMHHISAFYGVNLHRIGV